MPTGRVQETRGARKEMMGYKIAVDKQDVKCSKVIFGRHEAKMLGDAIKDTGYWQWVLDTDDNLDDDEREAIEAMLKGVADGHENRLRLLY